MTGFKYILASNDDSVLQQADELGPLLAEAEALVKNGDYSVTDLYIYTMSHTFELPTKPKLILKAVR